MGETVRITVHGAAKTVTGSKYLVESSRASVLVDCGLFQGRKELRLRNWAKPNFDAKELHSIVLTHAHIDHIGYLPCVVRQGFKGPIYCTEATARLCTLLLLDSAHLQEEEARYANKEGSSKHHPAKPLYTQDDARKALSLLHPVSRSQATEVAPGVIASYTAAGHILGACALSLDLEGKRITFSGDIGRYDAPILPDPQPHAIGDVLFCESTYGDRLHEKETSEQTLAEIIRQAASRKGPLIIPAFAVGRTQTLLYLFAKLEREGKIPVLPVYVDSPMAVDVTKIYREFHHDFDDDAQEIQRVGDSPLLTERTTFCQTADQSKKLNTLTGARIIISASGMVNGGRIMHHMMHHLSDPKTTVLFVGYQAEDTRGRLILSGAPHVKFFGKEIPVRAQVAEMSGLSAHGDKSELIRWLKSCNGSPSIVRIIHGEPEPARHFAQEVVKTFSWQAAPAEQLEQIEI